MTSTTTPTLVRWARMLEESEALDQQVRALEPTIRQVFGSGARGSVLRGEWLGHAVHPVLTDLVIGTWTSATVLDLFAGEESRAAAQKLVGAGLLAVGPTAWTGWAEWSEAGPREKRVGVVHVAVNVVAILSYTASWAARRAGHHRTGAGLALAGGGAAGAAAYLGGHLAVGRKVGTRDPALVTDAAQPSQAAGPVPVA